jgi:opacity protein-like surface antigen
MKKIVHYIYSVLLVFCLFVFPFQSASAQSSETGGYIGFWGGFTIAPDASSDDYDDDWYYDDYDLDMEETWAAGVKFGYTPPPWKYFSFEFEYSYLNPDIKKSILERYGPDYLAVEGDVRTHNFMLNLFIKYPLGWFHPYLGAGLGFSYSDVSATATQRIGADITTAPVGDDYTSFAYQFLTGAEFEVTKNLAFDIGYRYYTTGLKFKNNDPDIYLDDSVDIDFTTSMITLGLKVLF